MKNRSPFPWHYYIRAVRTRLFFISLACLLTYLAYSLYPNSFLGKELIVLAFLAILTLIHSFFRVAPVRHLLSRLEAVQEQLPHDRKLDLIYQKNEFELIDEMLSLTENQLKEQRENYENQMIQSDTVLEYIPNAVVIIDKFKNCKVYNRLFKEKFIRDKNITGVDKEKLWKVFDQHAELLEVFDQAISEDKRISIQGRPFEELNEFYDITVTPIRDNKGELTGALGIFHNVTRSKLTEKMRVDFVANVSHEIRTPLTSIKGYSQLLQAHKDKIPSELEPILGKINSNTERLKELFDNLLKLSIIESQSEIAKTPFELDGLVKLIRSRLKGKYLHKDFEINSPTDFKIWGDKKLLDQVFANLIDNAVKYSDKDKTVVDIEAREEGNATLITVRDNGSGFESDEQERIFERFYRIQGQSLEPVEGSGLGLSIVKHILTKHNGSIKASSTKGEGSTFTISLPKIGEC